MNYEAHPTNHLVHNEGSHARRRSPEVRNPENPRPTDVAAIVKEFLAHLREDQGRKDQEGVRGALKMRAGIKCYLTTKELRQEDNKGLQHLNKYIHEVQLACPRESMRVAMIPMTCEPELLQRLSLGNEEALQEITWEGFKKLAMAKIPKVGACDAETQLLRTQMTKEDDIEEFTTRVRKSYRETCQLLGLPNGS